MKCKQCKECNGYACRGEIPGMGGKGLGLTFIRNVEKLKDIRLCLDVVVQSKAINTTSHLFDMPVDLPVYCAPMAGIENNYGVAIDDFDYTKAILKGCKAAGTIAFTGDGKDIQMFTKPMDAIEEMGGYGICTMKPWIQKGIDMRLEALKGKKVLALATDIDSAGLALLRNSEIPVETKSESDLSVLKASLNVPLIIKGVMTKAAALSALHAGADGIIISNHGGRVLDQGLATIEVLEEIVAAVNGQMTILIDGGFRSGYDVFKALALGANGVLIGRPLGLAACLDLENGVSNYLAIIKEELKDAMLMTGCHSISDITKNKVKIAK